MSTACLWNRGGQAVAVTITRTQGDDIPADHYEAYVIGDPPGQIEFVPIAELVPHHTNKDLK